jgi:hypothetical protein
MRITNKQGQVHISQSGPSGELARSNSNQVMIDDSNGSAKHRWFDTQLIWSNPAIPIWYAV